MTAQEFKTLARNYQKVADILVEFRRAHPAETVGQGDTFNRTIGDLLKNADETINRAVELALVDLGVSANELRDATQEAAAALKSIGTVTKVLSIAGAVVELGACILHPTPAGVAGALTTLSQVLPKVASPSSISG